MDFMVYLPIPSHRLQFTEVVENFDITYIENIISPICIWSSLSVSTFLPISEFSYSVIRFLNQIFLSLTFPICHFTIELLSKKSDNEIAKVNDKNKTDLKIL